MKTRKKVIYQCYGGAHSSIVAAAIHTLILNREEIPTSEEFLQVPYFDKGRKEEVGRLIFFGTAQGGVEVFAMGMGRGSQVLKNVLSCFLQDDGVSSWDFLLVNTLSRVNLPTRVGGFLSRGLGLVSFGRPLILWGMKASYYSFVQLVEEVEKKIRLWELDEGKEI